MGCVKSACPIKVVSSTKITNQKTTKTNKTNKTTIVKNNKSDSTIKIQNIITKVESRMEDNYKILSKLGSGGFGSVYKVQHYTTHKIYAMKVVRKINMKYQDGDQTFLKEIEILITLDHPNIIKIFEYYEDEINYYLITEYVSGGELFDYVSRDTEFTDFKAKKIMRQILQALSYLHSNNIVHRDIKSENILVELTNDDNDEFNLKIIDFGTCNYIPENEQLTVKVGSPYYIAPEVLNGNYNMKCDIWSAGIILYILLMGFPPFNGKNCDELYRLIKKGKLDTDLPQWKRLSPITKDLLSNMLMKDINQRLTAQECLNHPWFNEEGFKSKNTCSDKLMHTALTNIVSFNAKEKLQQATIAYIVHFVYYSEELNQLKAVFKQLDVNDDGMLTITELKNGFDLYFGKGISEIKLNEIMEDIDGNNDGVISYEEFLRVAIKKERLLEEQHLKFAFDKFDINKDGKLSKDELKKVLCASNLDYINVLLKEIDTNGDGFLNYEEFKCLMQSILTNKQIIIKEPTPDDEKEIHEKLNTELSYKDLLNDVIYGPESQFSKDPSHYKFLEELKKKTNYNNGIKMKESTNNASSTTAMLTNQHISVLESKIFDKNNANFPYNDNSLFKI